LPALAAAPDAEHWYQISIAGHPAGYVHELTRPHDSAGSQTQTETRIAVQRMSTRVDFRVEQTEEEDSEGHLRRLQVRIHSSRDESTLTVEIDAGQLRITTGADGRSYSRVVDETRPLLGTEGLRLRARSWLLHPEQPLVDATFLPEQAKAATVTRRLLRREPHAGRDSLALIEQQIEGMPEVSQIWMDADGRSIEEAEESPLGTMRTHLASEPAARAALGATLDEDVYARTLLRSQIRLPSPRHLERLRVSLQLLRPGSGWPDLEGPGQHVVAATATRRVLEISRADLLPDAPIDAAENDPDLQPNVLLQSDHPAVAALAKELRRPELGAFAQARVIQAWVAQHLQVDAGLAVAPAGEVVRDRRGSCVAYAVLTASLARAMGIPARVVLGYVYVDNIFGGHAWAEVKVGARWLPIDAAVYSAGTADAARIALVRHGGELGIGSGSKELSRLLGNVSIRIEGYSLDDRLIAVPVNAKPWRITAHTYRNPWLGLELRAPAGYSFAQLDAHYPDPTIVGLAAADGGSIRLYSLALGPHDPSLNALLAPLGVLTGEPAAQIAGRPAVQSRRPETRMLGFRDGDTLWVLSATGSAMGAGLEAVARSLRLAP